MSRKVGSCLIGTRSRRRYEELVEDVCGLRRVRVDDEKQRAELGGRIAEGYDDLVPGRCPTQSGVQALPRPSKCGKLSAAAVQGASGCRETVVRRDDRRRTMICARKHTSRRADSGGREVTGAFRVRAARTRSSGTMRTSADVALPGPVPQPHEELAPSADAFSERAGVRKSDAAATAGLLRIQTASPSSLKQPDAAVDEIHRGAGRDGLHVSIS
uniref:Uncharacterized protein n=1 Tax=Mycena chlorophos TaxID=658473 RepID=A0ABQ0LJF1_MYCCL|nr:predicted protein [Mycena chlorophos]